RLDDLAPSLHERLAPDRRRVAVDRPPILDRRARLTNLFLPPRRDTIRPSLVRLEIGQVNASQTLTIQSTPSTLGAVVNGISLANLDDPTWTRIEAAFLEHAVLIFPGQHLTSQEQIAFGERFGRIEELVKGHKIVPVSNRKADGTLLKDEETGM